MMEKSPKKNTTTLQDNLHHESIPIVIENIRRELDDLELMYMQVAGEPKVVLTEEEMKRLPY